MPDDDDYRKRQQVIGEWVSQSLNPERFRYKPWQDNLLSPEELQAQITTAFAEKGYWEDYGELRMGGGPTVRVEPTSAERYKVSAEYGIKIDGEYVDLKSALAAGSLFATVVWTLSEHGGTEGFFWP